MRLKHIISIMLAVLMVSSIFIPAVQAAGESKGIDLNASIKEPKPDIAISVNVDHISFGELLPGETSASFPVAVTNVGLKTLTVDMTVEDDGSEAIFVPGITVNGNAWDDYSTILLSDGSDSFDVALHIPDTVTTRGDVSGSLTVWAEEKLNIYSTAMANTNPGAPDPGIPGFVGPDGDGKISTQLLSGGVPTNNYVNPVFTAWATKVIDYYRSDSSATHSYQFLSQSMVLGPVTGNNFNILSLGDLDQAMIDAGSPPGSLTLGFDVRIVNGPGPDFACFENGFISGSGPNIFAELGYVEVSTDGVTFARFPSVSLTEEQAGGYGALDATKLYNLVGKHVNAYGDSWGTPFDLSDLVNTPEVLNGSVDLDNINFVRIVDIPGSGDFKDSLGNPIYDAWPTTGTGGLDFEALGVINSQAKQIVAGFSASPLSGNAPLTVQFTDRSVNATSWAWDFDNDGIVDSTERNPTWTYSVPMTYTVKLTVTNSGGSDIEIKKNLITVSSPPNDITYTSDGTSITITGYKGAGGDVIIPGEIDGVPVVDIGSSAFRSNANMTSVTIPNSVTGIGAGAFQSCTALESVNIGSGVTSIPANAFSGCTALTSVTIPDNVTTIGDSAFNGCIALVSVNIGSGVTSIGTSAFQGCTALTSVTIPDSVKTIGDYAFRNCALTSVTISNSVTSIGLSAFAGCSALVSVIIPDSVTSLGQYAFSGCTALASVTIGSGVTSIGNNVFQGCTALTSVTIPDNVTSIGNYAFAGCTALTSVTIPNSVTSIGNYAFQSCTALESVNIGSGVTSITVSPFIQCAALTAINIDADNNAYTSIDGVVYNKAVTTLVICPAGKTGAVAIPDSVTSIGTNAFSNCNKLTSVNIGRGITSIPSNAFSSCTALTAINVDADNSALIGVDGVVYSKDGKTLVVCPAGTTDSFVIPDGVTSIGNYAFAGCTALTSVTIPDSVKTIGDYAFRNCALTSVTIPDSVTSLGQYAFSGCTALASVTIGNGVTSIGNYAFYQCAALTSVTIPDSVATIGDSAFNNCDHLTSVTIGNGVTSIGAQAFTACTALTTLTIPNNVTSLGINVFSDCTGLISVTLGNGVTSIPSAAFYRCSALTSVTIPDSVTAINARAFESCAALTSVTLPASVVTIGTNAFNNCDHLTEINVDSANTVFSSVDGVVYNKAVTSLVYCPLGKTSLTIPDTMTSIPNNAFQNCKALTSVTIPDSVKTIGNYAFAGCSALVSVIIPDNVTTLGTYVFQNCVVLNSVTIGNGVDNIQNYAFQGCSALTSITIPSTVTTIGTSAFQGCTALTSINIPNSVTTIGNLAFYGCSHLSSVTIGSGVTSIGTSAFNGCTALTSAIIGSNVTTIGTGAFQGCTALTSVTIPNSVTSIGNNAFNGCTALTSVTIGSGVTSIGSAAFRGCTALTSIIFQGNAPATVAANWASGATNLLVYYNESATGFDTPTWNGVPCYPAVAPAAAFSANVVSGVAPVTVRFTDLSANHSTSWSWDFDGDGVADSFEKNPTWIFSAPGTYTVTLTVSNPFGNDTVVKTAFITVTEAPPASDWAYFQGNQQLNGYHDGNAPDSNDLKWVSDAIDAWPSSSVVIAEGKVFVYCYNETEEKGYIAALYLSNGTIAWMEPMLTNPLWDSWATPAYHDGLVFTAGDTARYASNGTIAWPDGRTVGTASTTNGGPMIAEGKVFVGDWDGHHYFAYDEKTGAQVWQFTVPGYAQGTPSYNDGKLFLTSWENGGGHVYCLNAADGTEIWHATTALDTCGSPCIADGYVYVTTYNFGGDGDLYCFYESNGTEVWRQTIQRTDSTPTVFDGRVYVTGGCYGVSPHQTYCFDAFDGTPIWSTDEEEDIGGWTSSVVIADGKLFVGREGSWGEGGSMRFGYIGLFALDIEDGEVLWEAENGGATVAIYDGVVFTAGIDGRIYAYGPSA